MSKIDVSKCEYKGGIECHIRDYPILNCVDVKIEDCHYKQLQQLKQENDELKKLKDEILNKKPSEREYCKGCTLPAYSKVLDEIEEIAKDKVNAGCSMRNKDCDFSCNKCLLNSLNEILQKIKEVKGNE